MWTPKGTYLNPKPGQIIDHCYILSLSIANCSTTECSSLLFSSIKNCGYYVQKLSHLHDIAKEQITRLRFYQKKKRKQRKKEKERERQNIIKAFFQSAATLKAKNVFQDTLNFSSNWSHSIWDSMITKDIHGFIDFFNRHQIRTAENIEIKHL